eukprot:4922370-Pyramimonas_sp.AAC.1
MVGIQQMEYTGQLARHFERMSPFVATGGTLSVAAGRLAYVYGLRGECAAVDTGSPRDGYCVKHNPPPSRAHDFPDSKPGLV